MLDYESDKKTYSFMVKATDPSGSDGTVMVTITLKDVDEAPVLVTVVPENKPPTFADDAATAFMVYENMDAGAAVGTVTATDEDGDTVDLLGRLGLLRCRRRRQHHNDDGAGPRGDGQSLGDGHGVRR